MTTVFFKGRTYTDPTRESLEELGVGDKDIVQILRDVKKKEFAAERDKRINAAKVQILPLQQARARGDLGEEELSKLSILETYCADLMLVERQVDFPRIINWPEVPRV